MTYILQVTAIIIFILIFYQDLKYRAVSWILFLIGAVILGLSSIMLSGVQDYLGFIAINLIFLIVLVSTVAIYILIRFKTIKTIFSKHIGIGDILFLIMVSLAMSPGNYILFTVSSFLFALAGFVVLKIINIKKTDTVPLAGLQAIFLAFVFIIQLFEGFDILDDYLVYNILSNILS